jgi:hypothetical protein
MVVRNQTGDPDTMLYSQGRSGRYVCFHKECEERVFVSTERFTSNITANDIDNLSFSWIQCDGEISNETERTFNRIFGSYVSQPFRNLTRLRPDVQEAAAVHDWHSHQSQRR